MYGLANMTLFLMLINFIASLMAVQLIRGDMSSSQTTNFGQIFNAFLAIYQIFSSENWTVVLYNTAQAEQAVNQSVVVILFFSGWLLFANCE
jgi:voltage-dependent calcium channel